MKLFFHKIYNWEYWPFQILYIPIYFLWSFYAIKARSMFFFNASNPGIKNGGFMMNSKMAIYDLIPKKYYPTTILIKEKTPLAEIIIEIIDNKIQYPLIAKPDIGLRGFAVKKIRSNEELKEYLANANFDFLLQNLIPFQNEIGIFYVRHPNEKTGKITGIVSKEFLRVTGDGTATIEDLIILTPRYKLQLKALKKEYGEQLREVLAKGCQINLVPFGNHARGTKFLDMSDWLTPDLAQTINDICLQIPEFYYGRFDIMYHSLEELERGENFAIVELNGAVSEPTHIYDPKHSIWFAWKELARHIKYMYQISSANHQKGVSYLSHNEGLKQYRLHIAQNNKIVNF